MNNNSDEIYMNPEMIEGKTTTNDLYNDLFGYLNEMLLKIPNEKDKELIMQNIGTYYDSLNTLLIKHNTEHPQMSKS